MSQKQARAARRAASISTSTSFQAQLDAAVIRHRAEPKPAKPVRARRKAPSPVAGLAIMVAATAGLMGSFMFHDTTPAPAPIAAITVADILPVTAPVITADPKATLTFARPAVRTTSDPDYKLNAMMAQSAGHPQKGQEAATLASPVENPVRTSPFGTRISPITGQLDEFHTGQDFGQPCGSDAESVAGGTVVFAAWHEGGGGNRVEVDHGNGLKSTYNHLESFHVTVGQHLNRGESLGKVGTTGASTGCHLHFETWLNGELTDPAPWL